MTALAIVIAILSLACLGMAMRMMGLSSDRDDADTKRQAAEAQLQQTARDFADYKARSSQQLAALRRDIETLEDDLANDPTPAPGARRKRIELLLSKAAHREGGGDPPALPGPAAPVAGSDPIRRSR